MDQAAGQANIVDGESASGNETEVGQTAATVGINETDGAYGSKCATEQDGIGSAGTSDDNDDLQLFCGGRIDNSHTVDKAKIVWSSPVSGRSAFSFILYILNSSISSYLIFYIFPKFSRPKKIKSFGGTK